MIIIFMLFGLSIKHLYTYPPLSNKIISHLKICVTRERMS